MNNVDKKETFKDVKNSVLSYIKMNGLDKKYNCKECKINCGTLIECYSCLLQSEELRNKLDTAISKKKAGSVYRYINNLEKNSLKYSDKNIKRLSEIIESVMFLKTL